MHLQMDAATAGKMKERMKAIEAEIEAYPGVRPDGRDGLIADEGRPDDESGYDD